MAHRIFIGKISQQTTPESLERAFRAYGDVSKVDMKNGFGFIFYDSLDSAQDAIRDMNGKDLDGSNLVVEAARSSNRAAFPAPREPVVHKNPRRLDLRVVIRNMHPRVSWQDLKDWAREAGDVTFTNVFDREGDHMGIVEYKDEFGLEKALSGLLEDTPLHGQRIKIEKDSPDSDYSKIPVNRGNDRPRGEAGGGFAPRYDNGGNVNVGGGSRDAYYGGNSNNDRPRSARDGGGYHSAPPPQHRGDAGRYDNHDQYRGGYDHHQAAPPSRYDAPPPPAPRSYDSRGPPPSSLPAALGGDHHRGGYDSRRPYSDGPAADYHRGPPPAAHLPPPPSYGGRGRSRSRSRSRDRGGAAPAPYYGGGGGGGYDHRGPPPSSSSGSGSYGGRRDNYGPPPASGGYAAPPSSSGGYGSRGGGGYR